MSRAASSALNLSPCRVGNLYTTMALAAYECSGAETWPPMGDGTTADFIAMRGPLTAETIEQSERVQIKAARYNYRDGQAVSLVATIRNPTGLLMQAKGLGRESLCYRRSEIDAFALVAPDGRVFRMTADDLIASGDAYPTSVLLRLVPTANGQMKGVRLAAPYEMAVPASIRAHMPAVVAQAATDADPDSAARTATRREVGTRTRRAA